MRAPARKDEFVNTYDVCDARGPIQINMMCNRHHDFGNEVIEARAITYATPSSRDATVDGVLATPSHKYMHRWLPGTVRYNNKMKIVMGTRPWFTSHTVRHIIIKLLSKEDRGWRGMDLVGKIKSKKDGGKDELPEALPEKEAKLYAEATTKGGQEKKYVLIPLYQEE